jgi:hypothetical protein
MGAWGGRFYTVGGADYAATSYQLHYPAGGEPAILILDLPSLRQGAPIMSDDRLEAIYGDQQTSGSTRPCIFWAGIMFLVFLLIVVVGIVFVVVVGVPGFCGPRVCV